MSRLACYRRRVFASESVSSSIKACDNISAASITYLLQACHPERSPSLYLKATFVPGQTLNENHAYKRCASHVYIARFIEYQTNKSRYGLQTLPCTCPQSLQSLFHQVNCSSDPHVSFLPINPSRFSTVQASACNAFLQAAFSMQQNHHHQQQLVAAAATSAATFPASSASPTAAAAAAA